jgi:hypothetical protein
MYLPPLWVVAGLVGFGGVMQSLAGFYPWDPGSRLGCYALWHSLLN